VVDIGRHGAGISQVVAKAGKKAGRGDVVIREISGVFAGGVPEAGNDVSIEADVSGIARITEAWKAGGEFAYDRGGVIAGGIVGDEDLDIGLALKLGKQ
jgi:hypothetical protein